MSLHPKDEPRSMSAQPATIGRRLVVISHTWDDLIKLETGKNAFSLSHAARGNYSAVVGRPADTLPLLRPLSLCSLLNTFSIRLRCRLLRRVRCINIKANSIFRKDRYFAFVWFADSDNSPNIALLQSASWSCYLPCDITHLRYLSTNCVCLQVRMWTGIGTDRLSLLENGTWASLALLHACR